MLSLITLRISTSSSILASSEAPSPAASSACDKVTDDPIGHDQFRAPRTATKKPKRTAPKRRRAAPHQDVVVQKRRKQRDQRHPFSRKRVPRTGALAEDARPKRERERERPASVIGNPSKNSEISTRTARARRGLLALAHHHAHLSLDLHLGLLRGALAGLARGLRRYSLTARSVASDSRAPRSATKKTAQEQLQSDAGPPPIHDVVVQQRFKQRDQRHPLSRKRVPRTGSLVEDARPERERERETRISDWKPIQR